MQQIIILGATGGCVDILDTIIDVNASLGEAKFRCLGFLDDNESLWGKKVLGVEVLGPFSSVHEYSNCYFVTGIGSAKNYWARQKIIQSLSANFELIFNESIISFLLFCILIYFSVLIFLFFQHNQMIYLQ